MENVASLPSTKQSGTAPFTLCVRNIAKMAKTSYPYFVLWISIEQNTENKNERVSFPIY